MRKSYLVIFLTVFLSGCATATYKAHPNLSERIKPVKKIAVMPLDVEVYKITAGGVRELVDEYVREAKDNIRRAFDRELIGTNYKFIYLPDIKETSDEQEKILIKDSLAFYGALDTAIVAHTFPLSQERVIAFSQIFQDKIKNFDYSFGKEISQINSYVESDALLFIRGGDYLSSGGRVALMVWMTLMGFTPMRAGPPHLSIALVDSKTGDILWYDYYCPQKGYNFRNSESVNNFVKVLLRDFPGKPKSK